MVNAVDVVVVCADDDRDGRLTIEVGTKEDADPTGESMALKRR
jgi:hypothetical protein